MASTTAEHLKVGDVLIVGVELYKIHNTLISEDFHDDDDSTDKLVVLNTKTNDIEHWSYKDIDDSCTISRYGIEYKVISQSTYKKN